ncbi:MAG: TolC family protein [Polyangiaceae bacterium]
MSLLPFLCSFLAFFFISAVTSAQGEAPPDAAPSPVRALPLVPSTSARVLTLAEVVDLAVREQPQLLAARAQIAAAEGTLEQSRSGLFPQITAIGQYAYGNSVRPVTVNNSSGSAAMATPMNPMMAAGAGTLTTQTNPVASTFVLTVPSGYWNIGLSGTQLIWDFGQTWGRFQSAAATVDSERFAEKTTLLQVVSTVRRDYFAARANKDLVAVAQETLDDQKKHLTQVLGQVEVGTQPPIALAQQRAAVAGAEVQLISSQNNYETAKAQLNQAVGIKTDTDYDLGNEIFGPIDDEEQALETLWRRALDARPEMSVLAQQRTAQADTLSAVKGGYGPTLSATGSISEQGTNIAELDRTWSVGLLASWPIFQGGYTAGLVRQAEGNLAGIDAQRSLEELQIRLDVDSAQLAVRAGKATIGSAEDAVTNAREQLRLAEQRYATGVGSIIELDDAQVAYTTAAAQLVQARYSLASARAQFLAAMGRR